MKRLYTTLIALLCLMLATTAVAQNDILLSEDFENVDDPDFGTFPDSPDTDSLWISWDEDGLGDGSGNGRPQNWYLSLDFASPDTIPSTDTNVVMASSSWLVGFDTSNTNWLITPALFIGDDQATLHWESAPFQGPRYIDGYTVKVLKGSSFYADAEVTSVFQAAEMDAIVGDGASVDFANFTFGPGYIHADSYTDTTYFIPADTADANPSHTGILEPHSVSLADFAGEWVFLAFHHDSADDNLISVDNIVVMGNLVSSTGLVENDIRFVTYPNPVSNYLNVLFRTETAAEVSLELFSQTGQKVAERPLQAGHVGEYSEQFDLRRFPAGSYNVVLTIDGQRFTKSVVRK